MGDGVGDAMWPAVCGWRHTRVHTVLYNTDTCAIHLPTSELSSNSSVYANTPSPTYGHPRRYSHISNSKFIISIDVIHRIFNT